MNKILLFFGLLAVLHTPPSNAGGSDISDASQSAAELFDPSKAGQVLLVGFPDRTINRIQGGSLSDSYRRRGMYQNSTWSRRLTEKIAEDYQLQKLAEWPMTEVGVHCVVFRVPSTKSIEDAIAHLSGDGRVTIVQKMNWFRTRAHSYNDPYFRLQSNMHLMQIDRAHFKTTGRNVAIAMIDTGVDINHPDLRGQITRKENFASSISDSFVTDMHGTAVAGVIVARKDNDIGIIGVAPDARLIAFKACWPDKTDSMEALCNSFTLALAVNTAIKSEAKILNMSLSGPSDPLLEMLINKAIEKGIIIIAADPGSEFTNERFPASIDEVISVQSLTTSEVNNTVPLNAIKAPGVEILTTLPYGTYDFISGSSIAAAQVSGIVALLLELKPELNSAEIKKILLRAALPSKNGVHLGINANNAILAM